MIRRAILKALAVPGYQVPFASREMPMPYGWGTGGVQVTAACLTPEDVLKVIDQGADDTTNAVSIRKFFPAPRASPRPKRTARRRSSRPATASPNAADRRADPCLSGADPRTPALSGTARDRDAQDARAGGIRADACQALRGHRPARQIATSYAYPVKVEGRYVMDPRRSPSSTIRNCRTCPAIQLFGAGREQRIYALPPYTQVVSLDFEDHPFEASKAPHACACAALRQLSGRGDHR
jgi:alpha-D-ribose 1-methylphosphonate 5-phosphate C-P lyase